MIVPPYGYDRRFDLQAILPVVDITTGPDVLARPGQRTLVLDFLSQVWVDLLDSIQYWETITWSGQKITTLLYGMQGVTSAWLITIAFNGLAHPMQLQPGMQLRIPSRSELERVIVAAHAAQSDVGKIVTL